MNGRPTRRAAFIGTVLFCSVIARLPGLAMDNEQPLADAASRLAFMRTHMLPRWFNSESGGVILAAGPVSADDWRGGEYKAIIGELSRRVPQAAAGKSDDERLTILHDLLIDDLRQFFQTARLAPGAYRLENYHLAYAENGKIDASAYGDPPIELPSEREFTFTVTPEHLLLIRHMNTRTWQSFIEIMDAKRPYGDMGYYYIDMADALGEPPLPRDGKNNVQVTPQQEERYVRLHQQMLFAVQAFWAFAR